MTGPRSYTEVLAVCLDNRQKLILESHTHSRGRCPALLHAPPPSAPSIPPACPLPRTCPPSPQPSLPYSLILHFIIPLFYYSLILFYLGTHTYARTHARARALARARAHTHTHTGAGRPLQDPERGALPQQRLLRAVPPPLTRAMKGRPFAPVMRPIDDLDMSNLDNLGGLGRAIGARPSACDLRQAEAPPRPGRRAARVARRLQSRTSLSGLRGVGVGGVSATARM